MSKYKPASRQELIDYCMRQLGHPVVEINIDQDQAEDSVEKAFQFWREFHFDASNLVYLREQIEASTMTIQSGNGLSFEVGDVITGDTSSATCTIHALDTANTFKVKNVNGTFIDGESFTTSKSVLTGTLASSNSVVLGNFDNQYFDISDTVLSVLKALPLTNKSTGAYMFDIRYQLFLNNMPTLTSIDLGYYYQLKQYLELLNDVLVGQKPIRFSRHMNRLYLDFDWNKDVTIGDYVVFEAYQYIDENSFSDVYNDYFLKEYLTALLKRQWGQNMKKFEGVMLPGGVTMKGQQLYDEAILDIATLEEKMKTTYQIPVGFFVG